MGQGERREVCNGIVDDGFNIGSTCSVGRGACEVKVANCASGKIQACTPSQSTAETCQNMGSDDDCNGIVDDVQGGCGKEGSITVVSKDRELSFDRTKTRAAMLPWSQISDAIVTSSDLKYAWLVVSGNGADKNGIAAVPSREIFEKNRITFRLCEFVGAESFKDLAMAGTDELKYSAHITARHGGSLDHLIVEVADIGGAGIGVTAVIAHDGTVESIQEVMK